MFENLVNYRHENKYIESEASIIGIESRLCGIMQKDSHVSKKGYYSIRSLYFDDYRDRFLYENIDGVDEREKWRIRLYDRSTDYICLERKIRKSDLISKESCEIDTDTFYSLMSGKCSVSDGYAPLLNKFVVEVKTHKLHPAVIVEYERVPFVSKSGNTRVTIDRDIRSSSEIDGFLSNGAINSRPVLLKGQQLLEVKYDAFLPDHIAHIVEHGRMRRETVSKYYLARKFSYDGIATTKYWI